jgi:hypothetical protein
MIIRIQQGSHTATVSAVARVAYPCISACRSAFKRFSRCYAYSSLAAGTAEVDASRCRFTDMLGAVQVMKRERQLVQHGVFGPLCVHRASSYNHHKVTLA